MKRLKISKASFQKWVRNYNTFGRNSLPDKAKAKHYPKEVKTAAVREYWKRLSGLPISSSLSKLNASCIKKTRIPFFEILADWFRYFDFLLDGEQLTLFICFSLVPCPRDFRAKAVELFFQMLIAAVDELRAVHLRFALCL